MLGDFYLFNVKELESSLALPEDPTALTCVVYEPVLSDHRAARAGQAFHRAWARAGTSGFLWSRSDWTEGQERGWWGCPGKCRAFADTEAAPWAHAGAANQETVQHPLKLCFAYTLASAVQTLLLELISVR